MYTKLPLVQTILILINRIKYGYYYNNYLEKKSNKKILKNNRLKSNIQIKEPLVSVLIPTYNRADLLTKRTIPSVLMQTYKNFELIIVGDHCTDDTEEKIKKFKDKRIKFYNLPERGKYPDNPRYRWWVAGVTPANKAIELSSGEWIAPLDDDDEFSDNHIEILLKFALEKNYELVYGKVEMEIKENTWGEEGSYPLRKNKISRMSALYHSKLKFINYNIDSWKYGEAADWNMWRRMKEAGAKIGFIDEIVGKHYMEHTQKED